MKNFLIVCAGLLILALFNLPIGYYTILRIIVTIGGLAILVREIKFGLNQWVIIFGFIVVIFNPIIPVYLQSKVVWALIDIVCASLFIIKSFTLKSIEDSYVDNNHFVKYDNSVKETSSPTQSNETFSSETYEINSFKKEWENDVTNEQKLIFELHLFFKQNNINIRFDSSIGHQYKEIYNRDYAVKDNVNFKELLKLESLNLRGAGINGFSFYYVRYFKSLKRLTYFNLSDIIQGIGMIGELKNLEDLELMVMNFQNVSFLRTNSKLKRLKLHTRELQNHNFLSSCKELRDLSIVGEIKDLSFLSDLPNLERLSISIKELKSESPIFGLEKLKELHIMELQNVANFNAFVRLNKLRVLRCHWLDLNSISFLKSLNLNELYARKGNLSEQDIDWINDNIKDVLLI